MSEEQEVHISKYSSGISILVRVDGLWKNANSYSIGGLFDKWNRVLDVIWRELARDLTDTDYSDTKKAFDKFDKDLVATGNFVDSGSKTFDEPSAIVITNRAKQYITLNDKELFLKRLENKLGKGTTFDDGEDDDFE